MAEWAEVPVNPLVAVSALPIRNARSVENAEQRCHEENGTMIRSFVERHAVACFCTLTLVLSFASYLLPIPREAILFVLVLTPAFIAICLAAIAEGMPGVRSLVSTLSLRRLSLKWAIIAVVVALAMRLSISIVAFLLGWIPAIQLRPISLAEAVLLAVILLISAIPEELGWRGFALNRLLTQHSALLASLVLGVVWGLVHLVLHLPGMQNESLPWPTTMIELVALSVLLTWFFIHGGQSVLLTSLFHAAQSFFVIVNDGVPLSQIGWLWALVWAGAAVIVVMVSWPQWRAVRLRLSS
jgi:membrane protease YdiL (CAAX protease family)